MNNALFLGDCLSILRNWYNTGNVGFIDLSYNDPPFNSKRNYNIVFNNQFNTSEEIFKDTWSNTSYLDELDEIHALDPMLFKFLKLIESSNVPISYISYLTHMGIRCWYIRHMLRETATFFYHCDPHMSHYIKMLLDNIFGVQNFRNEITWCYAGGGVPKNDFARKHDIIFRYTKSDKYTFNTIYKPYSDDTAAVGRHSTLSGNQPLNKEGTPLNDWWDDIRPLINRNNEKLGYPTQKPISLLNRIIYTCSNEGDVVSDFFMGGGTTIVAAERLKRKWIGVDINFRALQTTCDVLKKLDKEPKEDFVIDGIPKSADELRRLVNDNIIGVYKNSKFALQDIVIKYYLPDVVVNDKKTKDSSVDGYFGFTYDGNKYVGLVQVTAGSNFNHFKSFCAQVLKEKSIGFYIAFEDRITKQMRIDAANFGTFKNVVNKIQLLSIENIINNSIDVKQLLPFSTKKYQQSFLNVDYDIPLWSKKFKTMKENLQDRLF
jgi:site-specific DNA-methyltransferase (adenine-specific)